jgi:hypothetical protein
MVNILKEYKEKSLVTLCSVAWLVLQQDLHLHYINIKINEIYNITKGTGCQYIRKVWVC